VFWVGFLVWVAFWGLDCCGCCCVDNNALHIEVLCCLVVGCWSVRVFVIRWFQGASELRYLKRG
jgi:hypothetical protein